MAIYRITNWPEYNRALKNRGGLTIWFSDADISAWKNQEYTGEKGRPKIYSNEAILCALVIRAVFHLPLRALEGFLSSIIEALKLSLPVPSYTQISRRSVDLGKALSRLSTRRPTDLVFDSTGLKVYGEGEWKVRQHKASKRRTWRKLHIALDPKSGEVICSELTTCSEGDAETGERMLEKAPKTVRKVYGDGAYDSADFRKGIHQKGAQAIIPPPRNARINPQSKEPEIQARNDDITIIRGFGGDDKARKIWKVLIGYHRRSLVETMMYRIKQLLGPSLRSRTMDRQSVESKVKCLVINKMTGLGMPKGKWVEAA